VKKEIQNNRTYPGLSIRKTIVGSALCTVRKQHILHSFELPKVIKPCRHQDTGNIWVEEIASEPAL